MVKSERYQKQEFKRTLALCPKCHEYMGAIRTDCQALGKKYVRALPMKYCIKCKLILVLDKTLEIQIQETSTHAEAWNKNHDYRHNKSRRSKQWMIDIRNPSSD